MVPGFLRKIPVPRIKDLNFRVINPFGPNRVAHTIERQTKYVQPGPHIAHTAGSESGC
jgi:hypothetical protein